MKQSKINSLKQKIICIPIIMMTLISFIIPNYAQAKGLGETVLETIQEILISIPDAIVFALENFFLGNKDTDKIIVKIGDTVDKGPLEGAINWIENIPVIGGIVSWGLDISSDFNTFTLATIYRNAGMDDMAEITELKGDLLDTVYANITYAPKIIFSNKVPALDANFFRKDSQYSNKSKSIAYQLKNLIATWYVSLRNIALVLMLLVLVWIGIKITLSSVSSEKAKYKQLLVDWLVAICLLMFLHYIMIFLVNIVDLFNQMIAGNIAQDKLINMSRIRASGLSTVSEKFYWGLIYTVLVIYTLMFTWQYLKRVIRIAFLTLLAPIMATTYPIDKMTDGQAQGFNKWLKDYIYELLIQPLHLLLYTILISSVSSLAQSNPIYAIVALGSFIPIEKMLREYLQFDKGHVKPPNPAGLLAAATLGKTAMNALLPSNVKNKSGKGGDSRDGSNERPVDTSRGDNPYTLLGGGNGETEEEGQEETAEDGVSNRPQPEGLNSGQNEQENEDGRNEADTNTLPNNQENGDPLRGTLNRNEDINQNAQSQMQNEPDDWETLKGTLNETGKDYGKGSFSSNPADYAALRAAQKGIPKTTKATKNKQNIKKPSNFKRGAGAVARKYGGNFVRNLTGGKTGIRGVGRALAGVAKVGTGIVGGVGLATAGVAMGIAMGDVSKGVQLGAAGLATGYGAGSRLAGAATGLIGKGANAVTGVANTYSSEANPEKYDQKLKEKEQKQIVNDIRDNDNAMRMFRMKNPNMTDKEITSGINDCVAQGIDNIEDMQKIFELEEKAGVDRSTAIGAMKVSKKVDATTLRDENKSEGFRKSVENNLKGRTANAEQKSYESIDLLRMIHGVDQMSRTRTQVPRPETRTQPANERRTPQSNNQPQQPTQAPRSGEQRGSGREGQRPKPNKPQSGGQNGSGGGSNKPPRTKM